MKICKLLIALVAISAAFQVVAETSEAESNRISVEWQDPKDFTDMKATNGHRQRFRENTMNELEEYLAKLAEDLPDGQTLKMVVTDVDLAGRVWPGRFVGFDSATDVRVVKRIDIPRMNFKYELLDANGDTIKSDEIKLKDMGFQDSGITRHDHGSLRYEKRMLKRWFKREFDEQLVAMN
ncbi:MAG: DUF3016 domain-containing protein [Aestuariibacter sp.]